MLRSDIKKRKKTISTKMQDLETEYYSLLKQQKIFTGYIQNYQKKKSNYYESEIMRFNRYLKSIDKLLAKNEQKRNKLSEELQRLIEEERKKLEKNEVIS